MPANDLPVLNSIDLVEDPSVRLARLLRAARALGGFGSADDLARALRTPGLGVGPLRLMETGRGKRWAQQGELRVIASTCGVAPDFFYRQFLLNDWTGLRIRRVRETLGATFADLADALIEWFEVRDNEWRPGERSSFQPEMVEAWEAGAAVPSEIEMSALCDVLAVSLDELNPREGHSVIDMWGENQSLKGQQQRLRQRLADSDEEIARLRLQVDRLSAAVESMSNTIAATLERPAQRQERLQEVQQAQLRLARLLDHDDSAAREEAERTLRDAEQNALHDFATMPGAVDIARDRLGVLSARGDLGAKERVEIDSLKRILRTIDGDAAGEDARRERA